MFVEANGQAAGTKRRLVAAATRLFAEHGFHGTTVRDIAARASVNVAAGNYHYGSKKALYLEVLRDQFAGIRAALRERGADWSTRELAHASRPELVRRLRARIKVMLDLLIGPPPGLHGTLMQREMCDPSEALPVIVTEFIAPMHAEMEAIVAYLAPGAGRKAIERCVASIIGQALYYRFTMPAMLALLGRKTYPRSYARELAEHIAEFSLGGLAQVSGRRPRAR